MRLYSRAAGAIGLVMLLGMSSSVRADIIYNNLGPGGSFSDDGFVLAGPQNISLGQEIDQAAAFTVGPGNYDVTRISVGLFVTGPLPFDGTGPINVVITQDSGGLPGNAIAIIPANASTFGDQLFSVSVPGLVQLEANTTYWVALEPGGSFDGAWRFNDTGASGPMAGRSNLGAWSLHTGQPNNFAFEVEGRLISSVPEPASALLLGMGVLGALGYGRLRCSRA